MSNDKLDKLQEDITDIKVILAENTVSLKEHIRRTNLLEQKMEPVEKHVSMVTGVVKFIGIVAACAAIAEVALRIQGK